MTEAGQRARDLGLLAGKLILSALLLVLLLRRQSFTELSVAWAHAARRPVLLAAFLVMVFIALRALRWHFLLRLGRNRASLGEALRSYLTALPFAVLTPARAGEMARAFFVAGRDRPQLLGLLVAEKLADAGAVALMFLGGVALASGRNGLMLYGILVLLITLLMLRQTDAPPPPAAELPVASLVQRILAALRLLDRSHALILVLLTLGGYGTLLVQYFLLLNAHQAVGWMPVLVVYPAILAANLFPLTLGGLGAREWVAAVLLPQFGISAAAGVNATFGIYLIDLLLPALCGALLILGARGRVSREVQLPRGPT